MTNLSATFLRVHLLNASRTDVAGAWMSAANLFAQNAIAATQQKNAIAFSMYRISITNSLLDILLFLSCLFEKFVLSSPLTGRHKV